MKGQDATLKSNGLMRPRVAFVVQRYGLEVSGGAEYLCRLIAERMMKHWQIEVLTTCAIDYVTWKNAYPEGQCRVNGVPVRRFSVNPIRETSVFNAAYDRLKNAPHSLDDEKEWMRLQGPMAVGLFNHIRVSHDQFDLFVFFAYEYCTSYFGLEAAGNNSILVPMTHDEPCLKFSVYDEMFSRACGLVYLTPEEAQLAQGRFPSVRGKPSVVASIGVDSPQDISPRDEFKRRFALDRPYGVYVGRIDPSKGCQELFDYFSRFIEETRLDMDLVLVGRAAMSIPIHPRIINLGFISDADKYAAIAGAELLLMPSPFESLSIALLEAWTMSRVALVNGQTPVLVHQCSRSQGGLTYHDYDSFKKNLSRLMDDSELRKKMGASGGDYARSHYDWQRVEASYLALAKKVMTN